MFSQLYLFLVLLSAILLSPNINAQRNTFRLPDRQACLNRTVHFERFGKRYHLSWLEEGLDKKFTWTGARNYCRRFCMDSITFNSKREYQFFKRLISDDDIPYIWTGGRKCNFKGCERKDLQPSIVNGWFWASTNMRIPNKRRCKYCDWSKTGGLRRPQPDNREMGESGTDEACIAVLNDFYGDGIRWHDVACRHVKPIICQDSKPLLDSIRV